MTSPTPRPAEGLTIPTPAEYDALLARVSGTPPDVPPSTTEVETLRLSIEAAGWAAADRYGLGSGQLAEYAKGYAAMADVRREVERILGTSGRTDWSAAEDGETFARRALTRPDPLWGGPGEPQPYWNSGEVMVPFGGDGSGKTSFAQLVVVRLADAWHDPDLLGLPVTPLDPERGRIVYLALDRPAQIAASIYRHTSAMDSVHAARFRERVVFLDEPLPFRPQDPAEAFTEWLHSAPWPVAAVIVDNLTDVWGDQADTALALNAGRALNLAAKSGVEVMGLTHDRKATSGQRRRPPTLADLYGGRMFTARTGAVLGLYADATPGVHRVLHLKGPQQTRPEVIAFLDGPSGQMTAAPPGITQVASAEHPAVAALALLGKATGPEVVEHLAGRPYNRGSDRGALNRATEALKASPNCHKTDETRNRAAVWEWAK